jgi:hypothetical protein
VWLGKLKPLSFYKEKYGVDHAFYTDELAAKLEERKVQVQYNSSAPEN